MIYLILANAGVPMIVLALLPMILLLLPVVALEFWVSRKIIVHESAKSKWCTLAWANIVSTFIGWPMAWILMVVMQIVTGGGRPHDMSTTMGKLLSVTLHSAWLDAAESPPNWRIPLAMAVLMIPFFFASVYIERWILKMYWKKEPIAHLIRFSWIAHFYSYSFLLILIAIQTMF